MNHIDVWQIPELIDYDMIFENTGYSMILNTRERTSEFDLLEKLIYDIAMFHFRRLNIDYDHNKYIEFSIKTTCDLFDMHINYDIYEKKCNRKYVYPLLSCIVYLSNNSNPTLVTNVNIDQYKYKEFETQKGFYLSFPRKGKHITFDGSKYHGVVQSHEGLDNSHKRIVLLINLWNIKPSNMEYYKGISENVELEKDFYFKIERKNDSIKNIVETDTVVNNDFFENVFYKKSHEYFSPFLKNIELRENDSYCFSLESIDSTKNHQDIILKNTKLHILNDITQIVNSDKLVLNRFFQRFQYEKVLSPEVCQWIISETEKYASKNGGWNMNYNENKINMPNIQLQKIIHVFQYCLITFHSIIPKINKSYNLRDMNLNIIDLFIVKQEGSVQTNTELHKEKGILLFNILLNSHNDFHGGDTYFEDGITICLDQGDMLLCCSKVQQMEIPVIEGKKYFLVGFIDIA